MYDSYLNLCYAKDIYKHAMHSSGQCKSNNNITQYYFKKNKNKNKPKIKLIQK